MTETYTFPTSEAAYEFTYTLTGQDSDNASVWYESDLQGGGVWVVEVVK